MLEFEQSKPSLDPSDPCKIDLIVEENSSTKDTESLMRVLLSEQAKSAEDCSQAADEHSRALGVG